MSRELGNVSCDLDPKVKVKECIFLKTHLIMFWKSHFKFCLCIGHMMLRVLGNTSCDLDLGVKVKYPKVK